jgi:hypothetical protein
MSSPNFDFDVVTGPSTPRRQPDKPPAPEPQDRAQAEDEQPARQAE